jgi:hypothetical protein
MTMTTKNTEIATQNAGQLSTPAPDFGRLLETVVTQGLTTESVAVVERIAALYENMEKRNAEKAFAASFVALQNELPVIVASTEIPNRGKYERFEDVMRQVGPLLVKHGFAVSFTQGTEGARITQTCHLRHVAGHSQSNTFAVRVGGKADSETQADCKASTTAKRNALLNALNIVIRQDMLQDEDDARIEGSPISWEQAEFLREQVRETKSDEASFLRFAGASSYEGIMSSKYDMLVAALEKKGRK